MPDSMKQPRDDNGRFVDPIKYIERIFDEKQVALDQRFSSQQEAIKQAREHIENIFEEHRKAHVQRHEADAEAIRQAREVVDSRLEKLNELRAEVLTDRQGYLTKQAFDSIRKEMISEQGRATEVLASKVDRIAGDLAAYIEDQRERQEKREKEERSRRQALTWTLVSLAVSIAGLAIAFFAR